jgi:NCAIR mutase (PurE)-related protein
LDRRRLTELLQTVRSGETTVEQALGRLSHFPLEDLGHARLDTQRELRCGFPEVVFGERKEPRELVEIAAAILARHGRLLVTRVGAEGLAALQAALPDCQVHARARAVSVNAPERGTGEGRVLVLSAGTADAPVAEEAELTARMLGARTEVLSDVGVAGLHRLLAPHRAPAGGARAGGRGRDGGRAAERGRRSGRAPRDRGAHFGRLRRILRRPDRPPRHAELLRRRPSRW